MLIFFWLTATACITSIFFATMSKKYSLESTEPDERKEKIFSIIAVGLMFFGFVFTFVTDIMVGQQYPNEIIMLIPFVLLAFIFSLLLLLGR